MGVCRSRCSRCRAIIKPVQAAEQRGARNGKKKNTAVFTELLLLAATLLTTESWSSYCC